METDIHATAERHLVEHEAFFDEQSIAPLRFEHEHGEHKPDPRNLESVLPPLRVETQRSEESFHTEERHLALLNTEDGYALFLLPNQEEHRESALRLLPLASQLGESERESYGITACEDWFNDDRVRFVIDDLLSCGHAYLPASASGSSWYFFTNTEQPTLVTAVTLPFIALPTTDEASDGAIQSKSILETTNPPVASATSESHELRMEADAEIEEDVALTTGTHLLITTAAGPGLYYAPHGSMVDALQVLRLELAAGTDLDVAIQITGLRRSEDDITDATQLEAHHTLIERLLDAREAQHTDSLNDEIWTTSYVIAEEYDGIATVSWSSAKEEQEVLPDEDDEDTAIDSWSGRSDTESIQVYDSHAITEQPPDSVSEPENDDVYVWVQENTHATEEMQIEYPASADSQQTPDEHAPAHAPTAHVEIVPLSPKPIPRSTPDTTGERIERDTLNVRIHKDNSNPTPIPVFTEQKAIELTNNQPDVLAMLQLENERSLLRSAADVQATVAQELDTPNPTSQHTIPKPLIVHESTLKSETRTNTAEQSEDEQQTQPTQVARRLGKPPKSPLPLRVPAGEFSATRMRRTAAASQSVRRSTTQQGAERAQSATQRQSKSKIRQSVLARQTRADVTTAQRSHEHREQVQHESVRPSLRSHSTELKLSVRQLLTNTSRSTQRVSSQTSKQSRNRPNTQKLTRGVRTEIARPQSTEPKKVSQVVSTKISTQRTHEVSTRNTHRAVKFRPRTQVRQQQLHKRAEAVPRETQTLLHVCTDVMQRSNARAKYEGGRDSLEIDHASLASVIPHPTDIGRLQNLVQQIARTSSQVRISADHDHVYFSPEGNLENRLQAHKMLSTLKLERYGEQYIFTLGQGA